LYPRDWQSRQRLQTHIAAMESVSMRHRMKVDYFVELESAIRAVERPERRNRQSTTRKPVSASALAKFGFWIRADKSNESFRLMKRIENGSGEMQACLWHHFSL